LSRKANSLPDEVEKLKFGRLIEGTHKANENPKTETFVRNGGWKIQCSSL
jgi:hypothetical protein